LGGGPERGTGVALREVKRRENAFKRAEPKDYGLTAGWAGRRIKNLIQTPKKNRAVNAQRDGLAQQEGIHLALKINEWAQTMDLGKISGKTCTRGSHGAGSKFVGPEPGGGGMEVLGLAA